MKFIKLIQYYSLALVLVCNSFAENYIDQSIHYPEKVPVILSKQVSTNAYAAEIIFALNNTPYKPNIRVKKMVLFSMLMIDLTSTNDHPAVLASLLGNVNPDQVSKYVSLFHSSMMGKYVSKLDDLNYNFLVEKAVEAVSSFPDLVDDENSKTFYIKAMEDLLKRDTILRMVEPESINKHIEPEISSDFVGLDVDFQMENRTGIHRPEPIIRERIKNNKPHHNHPAQPPKPIPYPDQF